MNVKLVNTIFEIHEIYVGNPQLYFICQRKWTISKLYLYFLFWQLWCF